MRGSIGGSSGLGRPGGGGGGGFSGGDGGGGGIMRSVGRVMRTRINGLQEPFGSKNSNFNAKRSTTPPKSRNNSGKNNGMGKYGLSVSSFEGKSKSKNNVTVVSPYEEINDDGDNDDGEIVDYDYDGEWECLEDFYDPVFGLVPSTFEVQNAVFSLQQFLHPVPRSQSGSEEILSDAEKDTPSPKSSAIVPIDILERASSTGSSLDWIEPSMQPYDQRLASSYGWEKVYDALHLLQTDPSVQKMVVSLSSDKAVWDAVLNNETVREIRDLYLNGVEASPLNSDKNSDPSKENSNVLIWIMDHLKGKLMEVVGNITQFVGGIFNPPNPEKPDETIDFSEKLKSSFMLTILILLIVVVSRGSKA